MNKTLSTFLRRSGDTGAFAAIPRDCEMFRAADQRMTKEYNGLQLREMHF
jgi:hypothetical protein